MGFLLDIFRVTVGQCSGVMSLLWVVEDLFEMALLQVVLGFLRVAGDLPWGIHFLNAFYPFIENI